MKIFSPLKLDQNNINMHGDRTGRKSLLPLYSKLEKY